jgi:hypothetical protein
MAALLWSFGAVPFEMLAGKRAFVTGHQPRAGLHARAAANAIREVTHFRQPLFA